jgi:hypothetical protein
MFALTALLTAPAFGQSVFKVYPSTVTRAEGGTSSILVIESGKKHFQVQPPLFYDTKIHQSEQSIVLTSENGTGVITIKASTNYAGALPKMEDLRDEVARKFPAASMAQGAPCFTAAGRGLVFDLFQPTGNLTLRIRDAYVSFAEGSFEFTLSCDNQEYEKHRLDFSWLLNSFQLLPEPAKKTP